MDGVNDEGFWEDSEVVAINEALLSAVGVAWYTVSEDLVATDWQADAFAELRRQASKILQRGFGGAALEVVKDPRFCVTLPFWLSLCGDLEIETRLCVISRAPVEIARSLQKRDAFPLSYGLRLYASYRKLIASLVPEDAIFVSYDQLLTSPESLIP